MTSTALRQGVAKGPARAALGLGGLLVAALVIGPAVAIQPLLALAVPLLAVGAVVLSRFPAASVFALFVLTGCYGTIDAFTSFPVGESVDAILACLWLGALWQLLMHPQERPLPVMPGVVVVALYLLITAFGIAPQTASRSASIPSGPPRGTSWPSSWWPTGPGRRRHAGGSCTGC